MVMLHIWTINGECRSIPMTEDMLEYEIQVLEHAHLANTGQGDFEGEDVDIIFNRDILLSESEAIDNVAKSVGILSEETVVSMHPWVDDPQAELDRIHQEKEENMEQYGLAFNPAVPGQEDDQQNKEGDGDE